MFAELRLLERAYLPAAFRPVVVDQLAPREHERETRFHATMFGVSLSRPDVNEFNRSLIGLHIAKIDIEILDILELTSHDAMVWPGPALIVVVRDVNDSIKPAGTMVSNVCNLWTLFGKGIVRAKGHLLYEPVMKSVEVIEDIPRVDFRLQTQTHLRSPINGSASPACEGCAISCAPPRIVRAAYRRNRD